MANCLVAFFLSSARLNWQCLESYSVPEFGNLFFKKNLFPSPKLIVSQCGFWTARLGTRVAKRSKECMFTNKDCHKDGQHIVRRHLRAWMRIQQTEERLPVLVGILSLLSVKAAV